MRSMTRILVIEDEQIERETLVNILEKGIAHVELFAAKNGSEALQLYEKKRPSIILADINIPQISGLEVIRRIKEYHDDCEFLILSSYNYFHYAQEAIRLGVEDFILKPYNINDLVNAVTHIIQKQNTKSKEQAARSELMEKLEKYTPIMENECFYSILSNEDELMLKQKLQLLDKHIISGFCVICIDKSTQERIMEDMKKRGYRILHGQLHGEYILFIFFDHPIYPSEEKEVSGYFQTLEEMSGKLRIGSLEKDINMYESYRMAKQNEMQDFANLQDTTKKEGHDREQLIEQMIQAFDELDEDKVKMLIASYAQLVLSKEKDQMNEDIQLLMDNLLIHLKDTYDQIELSAIASNPITSVNFQELMLYLQMNVMSYYQTMSVYRFKNTNQLVRQALKFIDTNYRRPITLNDMAEALHVSPFYISKLLNTSMKKTFTELISERRVEASKELLKTNKRIKEIAYEVGFQGQNYFTKIFKKYTGVTPKVYKNTFENES